MKESLSASSSSSSSSWWPSMLLVTCLGAAAIAFRSFNFGRRVVTSNNNGDEEDKDGDTNNAVAEEGYSVNLGFGVHCVHRFGVNLNLVCTHTQLGGNYPNVIIASTHPAAGFLMVSGAESASSSGR